MTELNLSVHVAPGVRGLNGAPLVSVVMPAYNVEKFVEQCIVSVTEQSLKDIEIIVINDGSSDSTGLIIDTIAASDSRIIAIHQPNGGYGKAVNAGLRVASGKYVAIVETDDWIEHGMLQLLAEKGECSGATIIKGSFFKHESDGRSYPCRLVHITVDPERLVSPEQSLELMIYESSIWSAIYRRDFLLQHEIWMAETPGAAYQDVIWKFCAYASADKVYLVDTPVYNYRVMAVGSSSSASGREKAMFENYRLIKTYLDSRGLFVRFRKAFYFHQFFDFIFHAKRLAANPEIYSRFLSDARAVILEAESLGIKLEAERFHPDVNDYAQSYVVPFYREIRGSSSDTLQTAARGGGHLPCPGKTRSKIKTGLQKLRDALFKRPFERIVLRPVERLLKAHLQHQQDAMQSALIFSVNSLNVRINEITTVVGALDKALTEGNRALSEEVRESIDAEIDEALQKMFELVAPTLPTPPAAQFEYHLRAIRAELPGLIADLTKGMDEASQFQVKRYFRLFSILPVNTNSEEKFVFPLLMTIFCDEERFVLANRPLIMAQLNESYADLSMSNVPITLTSMYYESGLKLVPYRITESFVGTIALDCGASVGDSAIPISRYGFKTVYCFEPLPEAFLVLKENVSKNALGGVIVAKQLGVDRVGGVRYMKKIGDSGQGSLLSNSSGDIEVEVVSLDKFCESLDTPVSLIKLDVEGSELDALKGAEDVIKKYRPVILCAVYHTWLQPNQIFDVKKYLEGLGLGYEFQFKWLEPNQSLLYEYWLICYVRP